MKREPIITTIGEHSVSAGVLPPRDAVQVQLALVKLLGPALFGGLKSNSMSQEQLGSMIMTALAEHADEDAVFKLLDKLLPCARVNGNKVTLASEEFYGDPMLVWQIAFHVLKANFTDFISAVRTRFGQHLKVAQPSSQSN